MGGEELIDALDELETEVEYDGYFCSIRDAVGHLLKTEGFRGSL